MNITNSLQSPAVRGINLSQTADKPASAAQEIGKTFEQALQSLGDSQAESDGLIEKLASGENVDLHQVMIASEQTDINFRVALGIRDKLVEAYREVMRMAV